MQANVTMQCKQGACLKSTVSIPQRQLKTVITICFALSFPRQALISTSPPSVRYCSAKFASRFLLLPTPYRMTLKLALKFTPTTCHQCIGAGAAFPADVSVVLPCFHAKSMNTHLLLAEVICRTEGTSCSIYGHIHHPSSSVTPTQQQAHLSSIIQSAN